MTTPVTYIVESPFPFKSPEIIERYSVFTFTLEVNTKTNEITKVVEDNSGQGYFKLGDIFEFEFSTSVDYKDTIIRKNGKRVPLVKRISFEVTPGDSSVLTVNLVAYNLGLEYSKTCIPSYPSHPPIE